MKLYVFRHGESEDNREHIFSGWRNSPLTDKGRLDALEVAKLLEQKEIKVFYSPDLDRNRETVVIVMKNHPGSELIIDNRLRERCYGELQGQKHLDLMNRDLELYKSYHRSYDVPPPGGESIKDVETRVWPFCEEIVNKIKKDKIDFGVCAGNNAMRVIRRYFGKLTVEEMLKIENPFDNFFEYEISE